MRHLSHRSNLTWCPATHFRCPSGPFLCLPVFLRCNGVHDCVGREDEAACRAYTCPGYFRCRGAPTCLHADNVCDGVSQCPQNDDELLCGATCPPGCTCHGLAFFCGGGGGSAPLSNFSNVRFLHGGGSGMTLANVSESRMLVYLSLENCRLARLSVTSLPNLLILDLTGNLLTAVLAEHLRPLKNLRQLVLVGNPLLPSFLLKDANLSSAAAELRLLDLSGVYMEELELPAELPKLEILNLSNCGIQRLLGNGFERLKTLRVLDVRQCPLTVIPEKMFAASALGVVFADNYKLCCPSVLPKDFDASNCHAPRDEVSSCEALLQSEVYRVLLSVLAVLTLSGNTGSFLYRVIVDKTVQKHAFGVIVAHLCVSDFLMGVYLAVIGVADRVYLGSYLWNDLVWKRSSLCAMAGALSLLSCEVSAFLICLITIDRFLVLRFPFSRFHLGKLSAQLACLGVWGIGLFLAVVPLLPATSHWQFYSQTGICIPLPVTRKEFAGRDYSFSVMIVLNFLLFLLIAVGQVSIYWSVRANRVSSSQTTQKSQDLTIARRLINIALTDFLCWFPIGVLGLLASGGTPIPGEVNVAMAILVLPLNSAVNPFLYTFNMIMERKRRYREERLEKRFLAAIQSERGWATDAAACDIDAAAAKADPSTTEALKLLQEWLKEALVSREGVQRCAKEYEDGHGNHG